MAEKNERELVWDILVQHEKHGTFVESLLHETMDRYADLTPAQRSFMKRLTEGTIERQMELDGIIKSHLKRPDTKLKAEILCLLRMSVYQLLYMDGVPDFAAVNEAVGILKRNGKKAQAGFVNGVLRSVCRDRDAGKLGSTSLSEATSMPEEILTLWRGMYGEEKTACLATAMLEVRPVCIRLNPYVTEEEKTSILSALEERNVKVTPGHFLPYIYMLEKTGPINLLPGFSEGLFTVQDESSALAVEAAGLRDSNAQVILDVCAAPGGKSTLAAQLAPKAEVYSFDLSKKKTDRIRENAKRLHLTNMVIEEHDATVFLDAMEKKADVVFCDLPCSGLGVITRKREIKYRIDEQEIEELTALQKKILTNAYRYVKPGGVLVYSTCTIDRKENEEMADFIETLPGMKADPLSPYLPEIPGIDGNRLQLFPDTHKTDGFFMARFRREEQQ